MSDKPGAWLTLAISCLNCIYSAWMFCGKLLYHTSVSLRFEILKNRTKLKTSVSDNIIPDSGIKLSETEMQRLMTLYEPLKQSHQAHFFFRRNSRLAAHEFHSPFIEKRIFIQNRTFLKPVVNQMDRRYVLLFYLKSPFVLSSHLRLLFQEV